MDGRRPLGFNFCLDAALVIRFVTYAADIILDMSEPASIDMPSAMRDI